MIDTKMMQKFIAKALTILEGEWVIIGGTVLPLLGIDSRITTDIDVVSVKSKNPGQQTLLLMEMAEKLGLPVEAINQAGAYFLSKIQHYEDHLILFKESNRCKIYRPDAYLFFRLKLARATSTDIEDCWIFAKKNHEEYRQYKSKIMMLIRSTQKKASPEGEQRLSDLILKLKGLG